jgi:hypothetical protein
MIPPFDIFQIEKNGTVVWRGTAETFESAQLRVKVLAAITPADYVISSQRTGKKTVISQQGSSLAAP